VIMRILPLNVCVLFLTRKISATPSVTSVSASSSTDPDTEIVLTVKKRSS